MNLSKLGGANSNFEILNSAFQNVFWSWVASGGAGLGELGGNLLPLFPINRLKGAVLRIPDGPGEVFLLFLVKKMFPWRKSKPRCFRNASEMFLEADSWKFSSVIHRYSPFFVLQRVSFQIELFNSFYVPVVVPVCFMNFYSLFHLLSVPPFDELQSFI